MAAIEIGYKHIDTAQTYDTEKPVGLAVENSKIDRDELFITTKITPENFSNLRESLRDSLKNLRLEKVDLTLIHWPAHYDKIPVKDYIGELARAQDEGLTGLIGVSNFTRRHLNEVQAEIGTGRLATNQFECHAYLQNRVLAQYCEDAKIPVTAYMPLAVGKLLSDPVIMKIAAEHSREPSQIALAFLLQRGFTVIPKSANPDRMKINLDSTNVHLTAENMTEIEGLDRGDRIVDPEWGPTWD